MISTDLAPQITAAKKSTRLSGDVLLDAFLYINRRSLDVLRTISRNWDDLIDANRRSLPLHYFQLVELNRDLLRCHYVRTDKPPFVRVRDCDIGQAVEALTNGHVSRLRVNDSEGNIAKTLLRIAQQSYFTVASFEIRLPFSHDAEAYYVTLKRLVHILAPVKFHLAFPVQQRNMFILSEDYLARARVVVVEGTLRIAEDFQHLLYNRRGALYWLCTEEHQQYDCEFLLLSKIKVKRFIRNPREASALICVNSSKTNAEHV